MSALELFGDRRCRALRYLGVDVPTRSTSRGERFAERGHSERAFLQADHQRPAASRRGSVDADLLRGRAAPHRLDRGRARGARAAAASRAGASCSTSTARKGPIREFTDDHIRDKLQAMPPRRGLGGADAADQARHRARRARRRDRRSRSRSTCSASRPAASTSSGSSTGTSPRRSTARSFTLDEMNHINFDWYAPANAHRQTPEEVRAWCAEAGLDDRARASRGGGHHRDRPQGGAEPIDVRHRRHCSISTARRPRRSLLRRMTDGDRASRPRRRGRLRRRRRRARPPPPGDHRPVAGRPPADGDARTAATCSPTTARSTTSASCARSSRRSARRFRSQTDTEVVLHALRASGARTALDALQRHVRLRALGPRASARCSSRATATASSRSTTPAAATPSLFGSEVKAISRTRRSARELDREALLEYLTFQNFFTDRTLFDGVRLLPAGYVMRVDRRGRRDRSRVALLGLSTFASRTRRPTTREYRRGARPAVPPGGQPPARQRRRGRRLLSAAAWTRARSRRSPRSQLPVPARPSPCGFDLQLGLRPRARLSTSAPRPSTCRTCSRPSTTRWC